MMNSEKKLRVLVIEDNADYAVLILQVLARIQPVTCESTHVSDLKSGVRHLRNAGADVVLLDLNLPDSKGLETLHKVHAETPDAAIIVLSAIHDDEIAIESVKAGAQDYLKKSEINIRSLPRIIRYAVERKKVEWQIKSSLEELKRLDQAKSEFITTVSHELRTPMTIIREGVSQIADGLHGPVTEQQKRFLGITLTSIDRLVRIVNDLLDMSCLESGNLMLKLQAVAANDFFRDLALGYQSAVEAKNIEFRLNITKDPILIYLDKDRVMQVFHNLMSNALKYTDKGYIEVSLLEFKDRLECRVSDTGCGVSSEDVPRLFTKFGHFGRITPSGEKGTGLGLAICKGIMQLHRGRIWVESIPLRGSVFCFSLPKSSASDHFHDVLDQYLRLADKGGYMVSVLTFAPENPEQIEQKIGKAKVGELLAWLVSHIQGTLLRKTDFVIGDSEMVYMILPATSMVNSVTVSERIRQEFYAFTEREGIAEKIRLKVDYATFPTHGLFINDILKRLNLSVK